LQEFAELLGLIEGGLGELAELSNKILNWDLVYCGSHGVLPGKYNAAGVSVEEHAVSVGIETVPLRDCVFIGSQDFLAPA